MITLEYLAGFFDGEGSVYVAVKQPVNGRHFLGYALTIKITNTNKSVLLSFQDQWGGRLDPLKPKKPNHKVAWVWRLRSKKAEQLLIVLTPHLIIKHEVAETALALQATNIRPRKTISPELQASRIEMYNKIRELNQRGVRSNNE